MGEQTNRAKVSVALIGVGPTWDRNYYDAVERLSSKISVRAVCDCVPVRASAVACDFDAVAISSPWLLTQRKDLLAWLILDPGWYGTYPAQLAARIGRPALYANSFNAAIPDLKDLFGGSPESGETLMPEFPERYTSATIRLRELMATRLGPICRIEVSLPSIEGCSIQRWVRRWQTQAIGILDWCMYLAGQPIVACHPPSPGSDQLRLDFASAGTTLTETPMAILSASCCQSIDFCERTIHCRNGKATISRPDLIEWEANGESTIESLDNERTPFEIVLDQFCRRALGGLLPVPTLKDAMNGIRAAELITEMGR